MLKESMKNRKKLRRLISAHFGLLNDLSFSSLTIRSEQIRRETVNALASYGMTYELLDTWQPVTRESRNSFDICVQKILCYLITGTPPSVLFCEDRCHPLAPEQRLTPVQAIAEISMLDFNMMQALQSCYFYGLRRNHLRQWIPGPDNCFRDGHSDALVELIARQGIPPEIAIQTISGKSDKQAWDIGRRYRNMRRNQTTEQHPYHLPSSLFASVSFNIDGFILSDDIILAPKPVPSDAATTDLTPPDNITTQCELLISLLLSGSLCAETYPEIEPVLQLLLLRPSSNHDNLFERYNPSEMVRRETVNALACYGMTYELLDTWQPVAGNPKDSFNEFEQEILCYLITGTPPSVSLPEYGCHPLPPEQRLTPAQAIAEITMLDVDMMQALQQCYFYGLRRDHLRQWMPGPDNCFTYQHSDALVELIARQGIPPEIAIQTISGKSDEQAWDIGRRYRNMRRNQTTEQHPYHLPSSLFASVSFNIDGFILSDDIILAPKPVPSDAATTDLTPPDNITTQCELLISLLLSGSLCAETYPEIEPVLQLLLLRPSSNHDNLFERYNPSEMIRRETVNALASYGMTYELLDTWQPVTRESRNSFDICVQKILCYLITGTPPSVLFCEDRCHPLAPEQRLTPVQAIAEISMLDFNMMQALQSCYFYGLRRNHLRQWIPGPDNCFRDGHSDALVELIARQGIPPEIAIQTISGKSDEQAWDICRRYSNMSRNQSTEQHPYHLPSSLFTNGYTSGAEAAAAASSDEPSTTTTTTTNQPSTQTSRQIIDRDILETSLSTQVTLFSRPALTPAMLNTLNVLNDVLQPEHFHNWPSFTNHHGEALVYMIRSEKIPVNIAVERVKELTESKVISLLSYYHCRYSERMIQFSNSFYPY